MAKPEADTKNKFDTHAVFARDPENKKAGQYMPYPRFFLKLRLQWRGLPDSFWTTNEYLWNATVGNTAEGIYGKLAYTDVPTENPGRWLAALTAWPRLYTTKTATYLEKDQKGSEFWYNPEATQADWEYFVGMLYFAFKSGVLDKPIEEVRATMRRVFEMHDDAQRRSNAPPFWTAVLQSVVNDKDLGFDPHDNANWQKRGFNFIALHGEFDDLEPTAALLLVEAFHHAWVNTPSESDAPYLPADPEWLAKAKAAGDRAGAWEPVLAKFRQEGDKLVCDWLTKQWRAAKAGAGTLPV